MSQTSTVPQTRTALSRNSSILLTPSKRRKLDVDKPNAQVPKEQAPNGNVDYSSKEAYAGGNVAEQPTSAEILSWTFKKAAITPCFVRDVFEMKMSGVKDMEYFWLGRVPCRTVRLVGLLVGVAVWDKRTVYTIDDGTATLECALAHSQTVRPSVAVKPKAKAVDPVPDAIGKKAKPSYSDYLLSARKAPAVSASAHAHVESPPKPVARVGQSVRIVGRVVSRRDTRILLVDEIYRCISYNDEPSHWLDVSKLHRISYYPSEPLPPFIPPPLPKGTAFTACRPSSPSKRPREPSTPTSIRSASEVPSANTSPSTSVATSSPASSANGDAKVPRLRHPSRLHTRDVTANTFRIYVKHYMDNAPPPSRKRRRSAARSVSPTPTPRAKRRKSEVLDTPARPRSHHTDSSTDATPRPSRVQRCREDRTPRPSRLTLAQIEMNAESESGCEDALEDDQVYGFTLSHLRRVPELSLMARRVIAADTVRREKEERKKAKGAHASHPAGKGKGKAVVPSSSSSASSACQITTAAAVKGLFKQAIRTLFAEGDIVLWSGPARPLPKVESVSPSMSSNIGLWRANTSTSSAISSRTRPLYEEWDDDSGELSDPQPGEEAYIPLTPAYFSRVLEDAIRRMGQEAVAMAAKSKPRSSANRSRSIIERLMAQEREREANSSFAPTKEDLLAWLRKTDERWARVGEWTVQDALEWGRKEGRLWCVGKDRWDVCG